MATLVKQALKFPSSSANYLEFWRFTNLRFYCNYALKKTEVSSIPSICRTSHHNVHTHKFNGPTKHYFRLFPVCKNSSALSSLITPPVLYNTMFVRFKKVHPRISAHQFQQKNKTVMIYITSIAVLIVGLSYAAVPLYTLFCQATGLGGQATIGHDTEKVETMEKVATRQILIKFNADLASSMRWNFKPQMGEVRVHPGETALAFYKAKNPTDKPIIGIATYNILPFEAGQYFNKIQCFCFEEQILNPHEEVDMPVFFYIDPDFAEDPKMLNIDTLTLSYTFFEAKEGLELPQPFTNQNIQMR
ncbi:cytochrome c oxidase assembly protein ctaG-like [Saccoglossus kowalevskii]|uniref:Cytochrome c oxidase assembly protein COX11, mitochondrial-like n=1 Tax=Saccoglossus kowalevskii TaxID=10224 RepID=A0ABM0GQ50_SACKO|nr:PREDICTED: cytochrome c oxidase assembly protein COX11, mitochondrial-like [Saccoglossus kowalevskii]